MPAAVSTVGNDLQKDPSEETLNESKPQKPIDKSKKLKSKTGKQTAGQVDTTGKKVKQGTKNVSKAVSSRLKSNKRGRTKIKKGSSPRQQKSTAVRKENASSVERKKNAKNASHTEVRRGKAKRRQIPLVPPSKVSVGIAQGPVKYTLKRAESNRAHRQRVLSNRRKVRRRGKTTKRKEAQNGYLAEYWTEPEMKLDDLSSLDCGSYSDNVEALENEVDSTLSPEHKTSKNFEMQDLLSLNTPPDFVFNISAPEFVPKGKKAKRKPNMFTMRDLVESVKGKALPRMPNLKKSYPGMCGL